MITKSLSIAYLPLPHGANLPMPHQHSAGAAGLDLMAAIADPIALAPGKRALVPTGFAMALPQGYEGQVRPRSGLAVRHGITVLNAPGTIDADYRGEIMVPLINLGESLFVIQRGERIAQLVVAPVSPVRFRLERSLDETERGNSGFGSTGRSAS